MNDPRRHAKWTPLSVAFARPWPVKLRGFILWVIAGGIGLRGLIYAVRPDSRSQAFRFPFDWITTQGWGVFVVVVCLVAAISAYCHFGRDRYGYVLMVVLTATWSASYAFGWVFRDAGDPALQGVLSLGVLTVVLYFLAGAPDVDLV